MSKWHDSLPRLHFVKSSTLLCVTFAAGIALAEAPQEWAHRGLGGGGAMYAPTINPDQPKEMYVGCDMSPQFHTLDGGKTWDVINFRQIQSFHEATVRFTKDPNIRWVLDYYGPGGSMLQRPKFTLDGGKTWDYPSATAWPADEAHKGVTLYADYNDPKRVVVATYAKLFITLDGGKTFETKYTTKNMGGGIFLAGAFFDGQHIGLGTSEGLLVSTDGGKTFAVDTTPGLPVGYMTGFAAGKKDGKVRYYAVLQKTAWSGMSGSERSYVGVYVLNRGDPAGWQRKCNGIVDGAGVFFCKKAENDLDTCYVAGGWKYPNTTGPSVFKTTDGGETWTDVFRIKGNQNIVAGWMADGADFRWSFPEYALGFDVCPKNNDVLIVTDLGATHASADGGKTWRAVYCDPPADRAVGATKLAGTSYPNCGMDPKAVWGLAWFSERDVYQCLTDVKALRSNDGGETWSFNYTGHALNTMYMATQSASNKTCYAATSSVHDMYGSRRLDDRWIDHPKSVGRVLFSTDNGANWKTLHEWPMVLVFVATDPGKPNRLYASLANSKAGGIYRTDDLDKGPLCTWTKLENPPRTEGHPFNVVALKDGTIVSTYAGRRVASGFTPSAGVFASTDDGKTWQDRSDPGMQFWTKDIVIDQADPAQNTWYACVFSAWGPSARTGKAGLYRTRDRGKSWALLGDNAVSPNKVLNVESCVVNPDNPDELYFTTEYDGLFCTTNLRSEKPVFKQVETYPFHHTLRAYFNPYKKGELWVTNNGGGVFVGQVR